MAEVFSCVVVGSARDELFFANKTGVAPHVRMDILRVLLIPSRAVWKQHYKNLIGSCRLFSIVPFPSFGVTNLLDREANGIGI